jgi:multidrug resistance protein, MATE family
MALAATASGADLPLREHVLRTLRLAGPVMLARAGLLVMVTVDTVMSGRVAAEQLAYYGIAIAPHLAFLLVGIGLLMGTVVVTAQTDGAGRPAECGRIWRLGLLNGATIGSLFGLLMLPGAPILLALGQDPAIAAGGGKVLTMFALGMPALLLFTATTFFLEGIGRSTPGMVVMAIANLPNFGLNYALMFEPWQIGAVGAAVATSITRWFMFLALAAYVLAMRDRDRYGVAAPMAGRWVLEQKLIRLGWPIAVSFGLEHGAFFAAATFAGWLGAVPLAAYQIVLNTMGLIYMLAIGLATATAVRVGNAVGRRDRSGVAKAGWVGVGLGVAIMLCLMPVLYGSSGLLGRIYTEDLAVIALAAPRVGPRRVDLAGRRQPRGSHRGAARGCRHMGLHHRAVHIVLVDLHPGVLRIGAPARPRGCRAAVGSVHRPARRSAVARVALPGPRGPRGPAVLIDLREAACHDAPLPCSCRYCSSSRPPPSSPRG